jgi:hypothetical protein
MRDTHQFTLTAKMPKSKKQEKKKMKHINQSASWDFSTEPFPAFRASLSYGRNKNDREFLPVKDVTPVTVITVQG